MNKPFKMNPHIWLGLILLLALCARTYHITYPLIDMHSFRQTQTAGLIRDFFRQGINLFYPTMNTLGNPGYVILEFPLYQAISAVLYRIFYPDVITARLFTIFCGLLTIVFVYRLTKKFLDEKSALFAAFFYAFMPLNIFYQRVPMPDPLTILLSLTMLDFMIEGINNKKNVFLATGIITGSLGLLMKSPYVAPLYLPLIYVTYKQERSFKALLNIRFLLSFFLPLGMLVLWQRHANSVNEVYFSTHGYPFSELYSEVMVKLKPLNRWYFGTVEQRFQCENYLTILLRIYKEMLSFIGVFSLALGLFAIVKKKVAAFYLIWIAAILLSFMVIFNLNVIHNYYQLPLAPILAIICGAGAAYCVNAFRHKLISSFMIVLLIIPFFYINTLNSKTLFEQDNNYLEIGKFIDSHIEKNAMIATSLPTDDLWYPVLMYYSDRHGFNVSHKRLHKDMIKYLRDNSVKYLAVVDYAGMNASINQVLCPYEVINENDRVSIYDITKSFKTCEKIPPNEKTFAIFNFESGIKGWHALGKVQITQDKSKQAEGKASLKITGTGQGGQWSFAQSSQINIAPGKRYRLTGSMFIESISDDTSFFKCECWQGYQWLKNFVSNVYNMNKKGRWQQLKTEFIAPEGKDITVSFAVEKRPMEKDVQAIIYIDEIKFEIMEQP